MKKRYLVWAALFTLGVIAHKRSAKIQEIAAKLPV